MRRATNPCRVRRLASRSPEPGKSRLTLLCLLEAIRMHASPIPDTSHVHASQTCRDRMAANPTRQVESDKSKGKFHLCNNRQASTSCRNLPRRYGSFPSLANGRVEPKGPCFVNVDTACDDCRPYRSDGVNPGDRRRQSMQSATRLKPNTIKRNFRKTHQPTRRRVNLSPACYGASESPKPPKDQNL